MEDVEINAETNELSGAEQKHHQNIIRTFAEKQIRDRITRDVWKQVGMKREDYLRATVFKR